MYSGTYLFVILLAVFSSYLGLNIAQDDLLKFVDVSIAFILGMIALYRRWKVGDVTVLGFRINGVQGRR